MSSLPPTGATLRTPRAQLTSYTPAVLRLPDGRQSRGELHAVSISGGLLALPRPLPRGSQVSLLFVTPKGAVLGSAEMLRPLQSPDATTQQPFRFLALDDVNRTRLKTTVQSALAKQHPEYDWVDDYRSRLALQRAPRRRFRFLRRLLALAIPGVSSTAR